MQPHHIPQSADAAAGATYIAGTTTALLWGLHVSDICMILSTFATMCGVGLQIFLATKRISRLEHRQDAHLKVTSAVAEAVRAVDKKIDGVDK